MKDWKKDKQVVEDAINLTEENFLIIHRKKDSPLALKALRRAIRDENKEKMEAAYGATGYRANTAFRIPDGMEPEDMYIESSNAIKGLTIIPASDKGPIKSVSQTPEPTPPLPQKKEKKSGGSRKDEIRELLLSGMRSPAEIAGKLNTNASYVWRLIKEINNESGQQ